MCSYPSYDAHQQIVKYMCNRTGIVAVSLLPIVTLLSGRNSPAALLSGMSFSVQMLYHRWAARLLAISVLWHAAGYTGGRLMAGGTEAWEEMLTEEYVRWGAVVSGSLAADAPLSFYWRKHLIRLTWCLSLGPVLLLLHWSVLL